MTAVGRGAHLSAGLGANEASDGAVVVVVGADEHPEERGLRPTPVHRLQGLPAQLQAHRGLAARVRLCPKQSTAKLTSLFHWPTAQPS